MSMVRVQITVALLGCLSLLTSCDQIGNRYEITKDQSGRTLRLDKRTGEVAVIEGERIVPIRSAKDADAEKQIVVKSLADAKSFPSIELHPFGLNAELQTSWQDGKLRYSVIFKPVVPKPRAEEFLGSKKNADEFLGKAPDWASEPAAKADGKQKKAAARAKEYTGPVIPLAKADGKQKEATDWSRFEKHSFWLVLEDVPFELAREPLRSYSLWNKTEEVFGKEAKGSIVMSSETYRRINVWNLMWGK